jgi:hypothetical protein
MELVQVPNNFKRDSILNQNPGEDKANYRIISEKVYKLPPQVPVQLPPNDD